MNQLAVEEISDQYVAGLFDGEGWFSIRCSKRSDTRRGVAHQVYAGLCVRDREVLDALCSRYGGTVRQSSAATDKHAAYYIWGVCGEGVARFVAQVGRYLRIKQKQAMLAAAFQHEKSLNKNQPCSDERFERLSAMFSEMKSLNQRGPGNTRRT